MSVEFEVREFSYDWILGESKTHIESVVVVIPNGIRFEDGTPMDCVVYAEDADGNEMHFVTVGEAQGWIDRHKNNVEFSVKHGNELHARPIRRN